MDWCDPIDKGGLLGASSSGQRQRWGEVLESGKASWMPRLSEPPVLLALSPSTLSLLVHLLSEQFPSASCMPGPASGPGKAAVTRQTSWPSLEPASLHGVRQ